MENRRTYLAFLLKIWPVMSKSNLESSWRASLENPYTGERQGFQDLDTLLKFLKTLTREETRDQENGLPTGTIK